MVHNPTMSSKEEEDSVMEGEDVVPPAFYDDKKHGILSVIGDDEHWTLMLVGHDEVIHKLPKKYPNESRPRITSLGEYVVFLRNIDNVAVVSLMGPLGHLYDFKFDTMEKGDMISIKMIPLSLNVLVANHRRVTVIRGPNEYRNTPIKFILHSKIFNFDFVDFSDTRVWVLGSRDNKFYICSSTTDKSSVDEFQQPLSGGDDMWDKMVPIGIIAINPPACHEADFCIVLYVDVDDNQHVVRTAIVARFKGGLLVQKRDGHHGTYIDLFEGNGGCYLLESHLDDEIAFTVFQRTSNGHLKTLQLKSNQMINKKVLDISAAKDEYFTLILSTGDALIEGAVINNDDVGVIESYSCALDLENDGHLHSACHFQNAPLLNILTGVDRKNNPICRSIEPTDEYVRSLVEVITRLDELVENLNKEKSLLQHSEDCAAKCLVTERKRIKIHENLLRMAHNQNTEDRAIIQEQLTQISKLKEQLSELRFNELMEEEDIKGRKPIDTEAAVITELRKNMKKMRKDQTLVNAKTNKLNTDLMSEIKTLAQERDELKYTMAMNKEDMKREYIESSRRANKNAEDTISALKSEIKAGKKKTTKLEKEIQKLANETTSLKEEIALQDVEDLPPPLDDIPEEITKNMSDMKANLVSQKKIIQAYETQRIVYDAFTMSTQTLFEENRVLKRMLTDTLSANEEFKRQLKYHTLGFFPNGTSIQDAHIMLLRGASMKDEITAMTKSLILNTNESLDNIAPIIKTE
jgi:hypothetical protein